MKLTLISKTQDIATFRIEGVTAAYANTLRRVAMTEVPTLAIERIEFGRNNSIIYDEMLAHRIGLVPLTTDLKGYNAKDEHGVPGNPSNEVTLTLKIPKQKGVHTVTAGEFTTSDPKIKPVHPDMPLVRLLEGQDLELVAYAELGTGQEHMKWSPCLASYRAYPHITITKQPKNPKRVLDRYPGVFEVKGEKLVAVENGGVHLPDVELDLDDGEATIAHGDDFIFTIESWGQLPPDAIMEETIHQYDAELEAFAKLL